MVRLIIKEISKADAASKVTSSELRWNTSLVIAAGAHSVRYDYESEIRFGPTLYRVTISGPMERPLSMQLGSYPVFAPKSPYQSELDWYAFVEWCGVVNGQGSCVIRTVDLSCGAVSAHKMSFVAFVGWRSGTSGEYVIQEYVTNRLSHWLACNARTGKKRLLFRGGYEGHVSADGRYLLVLNGRADVFVALVSIDDARVLDLRQAKDLQAYVQNVTALDTVSFDAVAARLTSMLNWTRTDYQTGEKIYEKLITLEVTTE